MYSRNKPFLRSPECHFGIYFHQNNPRMSAEAVRHSSTYIILYEEMRNKFIH